VGKSTRENHYSPVVRLVGTLDEDEYPVSVEDWPWEETEEQQSFKRQRLNFAYVREEKGGTRVLRSNQEGNARRFLKGDLAKRVR